MLYEFIKATKKTGTEVFTINGTSIGLTMNDFWSWSHSDLVNNIDRGKLAEFIVKSALNISSEVASTWDKYDLSFMGKGLEIKSSAYLQSWEQKKLSDIKFSVRPTRGLIDNSANYEKEQKRQADVYVLCLLKHKDKSTLDPLNLDQWEFYVVPTYFLNLFAPKAETATLSFLNAHKIIPCGYNEVRSCVEKIIHDINGEDFECIYQKSHEIETHNRSTKVLVYKESTNGKYLTSAHTGKTKTQLVKECSAIPVAVVTYKNYKDYMNGTYNKNGMDKLDKNFVRKEVAKHFKE